VVTWIVIVVVVIALFILALAIWAVLSRLPHLQRAALRLQKRQEAAMGLQTGAARLQESIAGLQQRAERAQDQIAVIKAGGGSPAPSPTFLDR
jgi:biopolymer transport protein ExbB/TolQ